MSCNGKGAQQVKPGCAPSITDKAPDQGHSLLTRNHFCLESDLLQQQTSTTAGSPFLWLSNAVLTGETYVSIPFFL